MIECVIGFRKRTGEVILCQERGRRCKYRGDRASIIFRSDTFDSFVTDDLKRITVRLPMAENGDAGAAADEAGGTLAAGRTGYRSAEGDQKRQSGGVVLMFLNCF